jgi:hypothetical protein
MPEEHDLDPVAGAVSELSLGLMWGAACHDRSFVGVRRC